jgi:tetratricopeptide (TPR) repeat protein
MDYRIEQLRYLLREDPSSRIFFQLGELLRREGEAAEAAEILTTGLDRHPRYVAAWVALGRAHRDLGALDEAVSAFETALGIDRENPVAARLLGETAMEREDWLGAVKALKLTRALAGGDEELDAKIVLVEERLGERGHLAPAPVRRPPVQPPERCLEVVSLSTDDPFAPEVEEGVDLGPASDVFEIVEAGAEAVTEAEAGAEAEPETAAEAEPEAEPEAETEAEAEAGAEAEAETEAVPEAEPEPEAEVEPEPGVGASFVDESSVGAWSEMRAAGVTGDDAWTEPTDEFVDSDAEDAAGGSWADPAVAATADVPPETDGADKGTGADDGEPDEQGAEPAEEETPVDAAMEHEPEPEGAESAPPVAVQTFEPIEVTHPDVVQERVAAAEAEAAAQAEEEARLRAEADEAARAEAEAAAKAEEEARSQAEAEAEARAEAESAATVEEETAEAEEAAEAPADGREVATERRHELSHGVPLPTMTLANLALEQGDRPLAMATLESLIERDPNHAKAIELLDRLRGEDRAVADEKLRAIRATAKIAALQGWLDAVRLAAERRVQ